CGHGTDIVCDAVRYLARYATGRTLRSLTDDFNGFNRELTCDTQFRWLGPEKGVIQLATAALINGVWDLHARAEGKPLWKLLAGMEPEHIVSVVDFNYISDPLPGEEAVALLRHRRRDQSERL